MEWELAWTVHFSCYEHVGNGPSVLGHILSLRVEFLESAKKRQRYKRGLVGTGHVKNGASN
jgi:hypothetical protein